jgi:hypothetical protein
VVYSTCSVHLLHLYTPKCKEKMATTSLHSAPHMHVDPRRAYQFDAATFSDSEASASIRSYPSSVTSLADEMEDVKKAEEVQMSVKEVEDMEAEVRKDDPFPQFTWMTTEEPHRSRRMAILKVHPEVCSCFPIGLRVCYMC